MRVVTVPHGDDPQLIFVTRRNVNKKKLKVVAVPHGNDLQLIFVTRRNVDRKS